ncbi:hypothetical protein XENORESO_015908 [Xenotaenia resolanae]|uniref:Uncharacterized protein n=1 Tax=Xenotaenia resolanae TaxID=208358 RepID=A0ABV0VX51_9TELE
MLLKKDSGDKESAGFVFFLVQWSHKCVGQVFSVPKCQLRRLTSTLFGLKIAFKCSAHFMRSGGGQTSLKHLSIVQREKKTPAKLISLIPLQLLFYFLLDLG